MSTMNNFILSKQKTRKKNSHSNVTGQIMVEVLVALALVSLGIGLATLLFVGSETVVADRISSIEARFLAKEGIEAAEKILSSQAEWDSVSDGSHGLVETAGIWSFSGTEDVYNNFTRKIVINFLDDNRKETKSQVSWVGRSGKTLTVDLTTILTNWEEVVDGGGGAGSGDTGLFDDWTTPQTIASFDLVEGAGRSGTDIVVQDAIVFISTEASDTKKLDFSIINTTNKSDLQLLGELDTGPDILSLAVSGSYVYAVSSDDVEEFFVIDINNLSSPQKVAGIDLSGDADALTIFYKNNFVYLGRANGAQNEFIIIDVSSPTNPSVTSELSGVGGQINDIYVQGNTAYLATEDASQGLVLINVTSPSSPSFINSINLGEPIQSVYFQRNPRVTIGGNTFYVVNVSDPNNLTIWGSRFVGNIIRDISTIGKYAFLATEDTNKEFVMLDIDDPNNILTVSEFNYPNIGTGVDYENNYVYVSVRSNNTLRIITSSP